MYWKLLDKRGGSLQNLLRQASELSSQIKLYTQQQGMREDVPALELPLEANLVTFNVSYSNGVRERGVEPQRLCVCVFDHAEER